jgi:hypothetical protein
MGLRNSTKAGATSTAPEISSQDRVSALAPPNSGCLAILLLISRYTSVMFRPENDLGTHTPEPTTAIEPKIQIPKPKAGSRGRGEYQRQNFRVDTQVRRKNSSTVKFKQVCATLVWSLRREDSVSRGGKQVPSSRYRAGLSFEGLGNEGSGSRVWSLGFRV